MKCGGKRQRERRSQTIVCSGWRTRNPEAPSISYNSTMKLTRRVYFLRSPPQSQAHSTQTRPTPPRLRPQRQKAHRRSCLIIEEGLSEAALRPLPNPHLGGNAGAQTPSPPVWIFNGPKNVVFGAPRDPNRLQTAFRGIPPRQIDLKRRFRR